MSNEDTLLNSEVMLPKKIFSWIISISQLIWVKNKLSTLAKDFSFWHAASLEEYVYRNTYHIYWYLVSITTHRKLQDT